MYLTDETMDEMATDIASPTVRCGNRAAHGGEAGYHGSAAEVRSCYSGTGRFAQQKAEVKTIPTSQLWETIPVGSTGFGFYALASPEGCVFIRVERPAKGKWAGRTFAKVQHGDIFVQAHFGTQVNYLNQIAADPQAAGLRYATELGRCSRCNRTLTTEESRARGIGPECWRKAGW